MLSSFDIKKLWKLKKDLITPNIVLAVDKNNTSFYFVTQDYSTIIFLILDKANITFCIPKHYCSIIKDSKNQNIYRILDSSKLIHISCKTIRNDYEKFVFNNLMSKNV